MATIVLSAKIKIITAPYTLEITDETSDYTDFISGSLRITAPSGIVFYQGVNDITPGNLTRSVVLPLTTSGMPQEGSYVVRYTADDDGVETVVTKTYVYRVLELPVTFDVDADGYASVLTVTDTTDYDYEFQLFEGTELFEDTILFSGITYTRTISITPPSGSSLIAISDTEDTLAYPPNIWSGVYTVSVQVDFEIAVDNHILHQRVIETETVTVYNLNISSILPYIERFQQRYVSALGNNLSEASRLSKVFVNIAGWLARYNIAIQSGDLLSAYQNLEKILFATNDNVEVDVEEILPFNLDTVVTYRRHTNLIDLGEKSENFDINVTYDSRQKVSVSDDVEIGINGMVDNWSSTVVVDITGIGERVISWSVPDSVWVDGLPITSIGDGETYAVSITTGGSAEEDLLINWVQKS